MPAAKSTSTSSPSGATPARRAGARGKASAPATARKSRTRSKTTAAKSAAAPRPGGRKAAATATEAPDLSGIETWWSAPDDSARLLQGDCLERMAELPANSFDVIFADPPYFLSNGGSTCQNGKRVKVDKGKWDESRGPNANHEFNRAWLEAAQRLLTPNGSIWVSGTHHVIYSVGFGMQQLGYKILNEIVWEKPNPPPNLSCRYFTHSTELVLWAAKNRKSKHYFDYPAMKEENGGKQMKSVWRFTAPPKREKEHGRHPTQKPLSLLDRLLRASCPPGGRVLDPFNGSGTTGVAAISLGLDYTGIELNPEYLELSKNRFGAEREDWATHAMGLAATG